MTLNQLLGQLNLEIDFPNQLGELTLKNEDSFCRYALLKYFQTPKFKEDLEDCFADFVIRKDNPNSYLLMLIRHPNNEFSIYLTIDPPYQD